MAAEAVGRAFVLARPETFTAELGYTALSRASERTDLYLEIITPERETHARPQPQSSESPNRSAT